MIMTNNTTEKESYENLPDVVLFPNHGKMGALPPHPYCGKREIFCGPYFQNAETKGRKFIHTKGRFFDIDDVLSQLDEKDKKIDLIFSSLESNVACFPKNLDKMDCPKLAFVFDTHHLMYPISRIIEYIKREKFTHLILYAQPAHLHYFYEAGFKTSVGFQPIVQKIPAREKRKEGITYIGKRWKTSHPRRSRMLQFLKKNLPKKKIPFHHYNRLPRDLWQKVLGRSQMVVISSLNGQFTPQINSCLFAGALCFVDQLSPKTLLSQFYNDKKHIVLWEDFDDLLEKIIYYYNNPKEAESIAKAGQAQAKIVLGTSKDFGQIISGFVFENKADPRFLSTNDARSIVKREESPNLFNVRVRLYENIQELHRIHESLNLISLTTHNLKPSTDLADLPRLRITHAFTSDDSRREADLFFQESGTKDLIFTVNLNEFKKFKSFDIGILEKLQSQAKWKLQVKYLSKLLKTNALLCVLGELTKVETEILFREGFKTYEVKTNPLILKLKDLSRKICHGFWKFGNFPLPYLTLKPSMESVPNLSMFLRGWQAYFPYLY